MKLKRRMSLFILICSLVLLFASSAVAAPQEAKDGMKLEEETVRIAQGELTDVILNSKKTLEKFTTGEEPIIEQSELKKAQCVVVFPNVTRVAMVVGGRHGDGVATCRGEDDKWSRVGFVDLRGTSVGAQIGVKSTSAVMLLNNEKAVENLKKGRMRFAADVSYAFRKQGKDQEVSSDSPSDVTIYSDTGGAFASASLKGSYVAADDEELQKFYQNEVKTLYSALSATPAKETTAQVEELLVLLPSEKSIS